MRDSPRKAFEQLARDYRPALLELGGGMGEKRPSKRFRRAKTAA